LAVLPGQIRPTIEGILEELSRERTVLASGLFGGWVRGDATETSGFDVLVVDGSGADYDYHEAREADGFSFDLNSVPAEWVREPVSPAVDHRLREAVIVQDPRGVLGIAKGFLDRSYRSPSRIEARTDGTLALSDMYLSRASGALSRRDAETAYLCVDLSLSYAGQVFMDIAGVPFEMRSYLWNLRRACLKLGMDEFHGTYMAVCRLSDIDVGDVGAAVDRFQETWGGVSSFMSENEAAVEGLHGRVRKDVEYLVSETVLMWINARVREMLDMDNYLGAAEYLRGWMRQMLERYASVVSSVQGARYDSTTLFRTVSAMDEEVAAGILDVLGMGEASEGRVMESLAEARRVVGNVRLDRRRLIDSYVA